MRSVAVTHHKLPANEVGRQGNHEGAEGQLVPGRVAV